MSISLLVTAVSLCVLSVQAGHRWDNGTPPRYPFQSRFHQTIPGYPVYGYGPVPLRGLRAGIGGAGLRGLDAGGQRDDSSGRRGDAVGRGGAGDRRGGAGGRGGIGGAGRLRSLSNPPDAIAFSGNRKTSQYFFQRGPVIFDDITTNIGGGYNADYGVFTAFESGIYLVSYNVVSQREGVKSAAVDLLKNNEVINSASGSGSSGETSNSAVVFLDRFDQLSVQGRAESAVFCGEGGNDAFCSFSVALLRLGSFSDSKEARPVPGW